MAKQLLATTQTETPDDDILNSDPQFRFFGDWMLFCTEYGSNVVNVQARLKGTTTWINIKDGTANVTIQAEGDMQPIVLSEDFEYRLSTATAGAEVWLGIINLRNRVRS